MSEEFTPHIQDNEKNEIYAMSYLNNVFQYLQDDLEIYTEDLQEVVNKRTAQVQKSIGKRISEEYIKQNPVDFSI